MIKVAINGFGRIGRLVFRQLFSKKDVEIVAINDLTDTETLAYLLKYDSAQGKFLENRVVCGDNCLNVNDEKIIVTCEKDPTKLPWKKLNIDIVVESTGLFRTEEKANLHIQAGAKKVIISAPAKGNIKTIVYNVNHKNLNKNDKIVSGASCTTNCLAPIVNVLHSNFKFKYGLMTTIHAVTNDQRILDLPHSDVRRGRSGLVNMIPTSTGAAAAVGKVLPELNGKLDGIAIRVPVVTGSIIDLVCYLEKKVTINEINNVFKKAECETLKYNTDPIVSTDVIGSTYGSIYDSTLTKILNCEKTNEQAIKIFAWYDNENSYVSQFVRTLMYFAKL